jgi:uncharacterized protein
VGPEVPVALGRVLRGAGAHVAVGQVATFARALAEVDPRNPSAVYWAGRATLVTRPEDIPVYNDAFAAFFGTRIRDVAVELMRQPANSTATSRVGRYSAREVLRQKDFAAYTAEEMDEARRAMSRLRLAGARRLSRRTRPVPRGGQRPDVRATVRAALGTGAEPVRHRRRERTYRPRRVVLLCDVSGSMEPYARALLRFLHAAIGARTGVEAFALGTRLTRLTRELASRDPDEALRRAAGAVLDWSGGTRLGDGLRVFNDQWGTRGMARGAVVIVFSDGWDRGDPGRLGEEMARLRRLAHRVVWVNPLKASPGYEPLARGMAAALPHVDEFVAGHNLASLEELAELVAAP